MEYKTKQRKILLDFFNEHLDEKFTAKMILNNLKEPISLSAIYRNLTKLESEGFLQRYLGVGDNEIFYQYKKSKKCENILHLCCTKCNKTFHMGKAQAKKLEDLLCLDNFLVDKNKTILYGTCSSCKNQ